MTSQVGVLRSADGMKAAVETLAAIWSDGATDVVDLEAWETTNLLTVSVALTEAARRREETRGSHWREDFPERDDPHWSGHFDATAHDQRLSLEFRSAAPSDVPEEGVPA
jgi:L-aspartate oxidase